MFKTFNSYVVYVLVIKRNEKLEKKKKKARKRKSQLTTTLHYTSCVNIFAGKGNFFIHLIHKLTFI